MLDDPDVRARVVELVEGGLTMAQAAAELGVTRQTLSRAKGRWPEFGVKLDAASAKLRAQAEALRSAARREAKRTGAVQVQVAPRREVIEPELVDGDGARREGGADPGIGDSIMLTDELLRVLSMNARDPESPGHNTSLNILARYHLEPDLLEKRLRIERENGQLTKGDGGKPKALVIRVPDNGTHGDL